MKTFWRLGAIMLPLFDAWNNQMKSKSAVPFPPENVVHSHKKPSTLLK